jgi:predicted RNase H-like nuclease
MSRSAGGIDGCRAGWIAAFCDLETGQVSFEVVGRNELKELRSVPALLGADMPIGLLEEALPGGRECDRLARCRLGPRKASVFSPPVRSALRCADYAAAWACNRASSRHAIGISKQAWWIGSWIEALERFVLSDAACPVVEVHPELSFAAMHGRPLEWSTHVPTGRKTRQQLLEAEFAQDLGHFLHDARGAGVAVDDVLDALAVCWTACRAVRGAAERLPDAPDRDALGFDRRIHV